MVLLFELSAFGIIFHGVKSVLFIGNLTHSPWTGHNYNRIHVPCLACDFICFKGHLTCAQGKSFLKPYQKEHITVKQAGEQHKNTI